MADQSKYPKSRSFRVDDDVWDKARERAESEGTDMSKVLLAFTASYAAGIIDAPQAVTQYVVR